MTSRLEIWISELSVQLIDNKVSSLGREVPNSGLFPYIFGCPHAISASSLFQVSNRSV